MEEIIVRESRYNGAVSLGGKFSEVPKEVPASLSVLTEQRIVDQKFTTVADALTYVTGVTVVPNDGVQSQYRSRGYALSLMNDGIPAYLSFSGYQQLDLSVYERLEVLRGPTGLLQGAGDPAGSVNLVSKRGLARFQSVATVTTGTWDNVRTMLDVTGPIAGYAPLRGRVVAMHEQRKHFAAGVDYERTVGYGSLDWDVSPDTTVGFSFASQSDGGNGIYAGLPSYESGALLNVSRSASVTQDWARNDWDTSDRNMQLVHSFAGTWRITARWWQRDQQLHFLDAITWDGVREADFTVPFVRRDFDYRYSRQGADIFATGSFTLFGRTHSLLVGYNDDEFDLRFAGVQRTGLADEIRVPFDRPDLVPALDAPYDEGGVTEREQSGLYVQARFSVADRARVIVGGRLSDFESRSRAIVPSAPTEWRQLERENNYSTPMAAVVFDATARWSVYGSYADTFTSQSTQLRVGGEPLEPRIGKQYEVGAKAEWFDGALQTSVAVFDLRDTGRSLVDVVNRGFFVNAGEVQSKGWEAEVVGNPVPRYEVQVGYSQLDSRFVVAPGREGDRFSAIEPQHSWKAWAVRRFGQFGGTGLTIGGGLVAQSGIEFQPPRSQGWYTVFTAMVGYRLSEKLSLDLNVNNLFDERYYTRLGPTNAYNTFGAPRNVLVTARVTF